MNKGQPQKLVVILVTATMDTILTQDYYYYYIVIGSSVMQPSFSHYIFKSTKYYTKLHLRKNLNGYKFLKTFIRI